MKFRAQSVKLNFEGWQNFFCPFKIKMATQPVKGAIRYVKPLISADAKEAKAKAIQLYKAWYRSIPALILDHSLPVTVSEARGKLREEFMKHKHVKDLRVIDMLIFKGQMEFKEVMQKWKQKCHIMYLFKDTQLPPPKNFLAKFLSGAD